MIKLKLSEQNAEQQAKQRASKYEESSEQQESYNSLTIIVIGQINHSSFRKVQSMYFVDTE